MTKKDIQSMTTKQWLKHCLKRLETGEFVWTPRYNNEYSYPRKEQSTGCLVNLLCIHTGTPREVISALKKRSGDNAKAGNMTRWNDEQKSDKPIKQLLRAAIKLCKD